MVLVEIYDLEDLQPLLFLWVKVVDLEYLLYHPCYNVFAFVSTV